jgi:carbamoylphosphate synthase large subunit
VRVAVTGVGGGVGQSVIRALRRATLPLHIVGLDADGWSAGLYQCDARAILPHVSDREHYLSALEKLIVEHELQALLPGTDTELPALSEARERFAALGCQTIVSSPEFTRMTRDKVQTYPALQKLGIPFVRTLTVADFVASGAAMPRPMMLKLRDGSGSAGARVVFSAEEVRPEEMDGRDVLQDYLVPLTWGLTELSPEDVQPAARLRQEDEVSIQGMVAPSGELISVYVSINMLRDGVPLRICPTKDPELMAFATRMFEAFAAIGQVGPCNAQGRITEDGLVLYELNPRFTGITAVRAEMGWNECEAALRLFVLGEDPADVGRRLNYDTDLACLRYVTEQVVPRSSLLVGLADPVDA